MLTSNADRRRLQRDQRGTRSFLDPSRGIKISGAVGTFLARIRIEHPHAIDQKQVFAPTGLERNVAAPKRRLHLGQAHQSLHEWRFARFAVSPSRTAPAEHRRRPVVKKDGDANAAGAGPSERERRHDRDAVSICARHEGRFQFARCTCGLHDQATCALPTRTRLPTAMNRRENANERLGHVVRTVIRAPLRPRSLASSLNPLKSARPVSIPQA